MAEQRIRVAAARAGEFFARAQVPAQVSGGEGAGDAVVGMHCDGIGVSRIRLGAHTVERDVRRHGDDRGRMTVIVHAGNVEVEGESGGFRAVEGDVVLFDVAASYRMTVSSGSSLLVLSTPDAGAVEAGREPRPLDRADVAVRMLESASRHLAAGLTRIARGAAPPILNGMAMHLSAALAESPSVWERFEACVERELHDAATRPESLAHALGVSIRSLHAQAAERGTSVMGYVKARRIERAKALLAHSSVEQVARRCGFRSGTHFGRVFRDIVGIPPSMFRAHPL